MKRRISPTQLKEITPEQQLALIKSWTPEIGDYCIYAMHGTDYENRICLLTKIKKLDSYISYTVVGIDAWFMDGIVKKEELLPLLDIGQMINIIMQKQPELNISIWQGTKVKAKENLCTSVFEDSVPATKHYQDKELINALWLNIKQIL